MNLHTTPAQSKPDRQAAVHALCVRISKMIIPEDFRIETERCWLTGVSDEENESVYEALHFPGFTDGLLLEPPADSEQIRAWSRSYREAWVRGENYVFTVWLKSPRKFVGRVGVRQFRNPGTWNLGFWIGPNLWGQGLAVEAAMGVIEFGFSKVGCERIWMAHADWNKQSEGVMKKLPVRFLENDSFEKNGRRIQNVRYETTMDDWRKQRNSNKSEHSTPRGCRLSP